jgi:hypothetical protein
MSRKSKITFGVFLLLAIAGAPRLDAQTNVNAMIRGTITDSSGGVIAGAAVRITSTGTGAARTTMTDDQGRYAVSDLLIGDYEVQASASGFQTAVHKGITLAVGSQILVDFTLQVGQTQQTVTVEGEVPQVETTSSAVSNLVDQTQLRVLPLNYRNVEQLILLAPGVQLVTIESANSFFGRQQNYSVAGGRAEGQAFLLDNQDMQNFYGHGVGASGIGTSLGVEAIAEFQTLTNTYSAQFGGNGASINSVSKAGTNAFHGSAYEFLRNSALDARQFIDPPKIPAYRRNQFGASVGGPIKKDRAFFFANYEGLRQFFGETKVANVPDALHDATHFGSPAVLQAANPGETLPVATAVFNTLLLFPQVKAVSPTGVVPVSEVGDQTASENYLLGRLDYTFSQKDSLFMRYLSDRGQFFEPFPNAGGGAGAPTAIPDWLERTINRNQFFTVEERHILSTTLINTARISYSRPVTSGVTLTSDPAINFYPGTGRQDAAVNITGLTSLGPNNTTPFTFVQNKYTAGDDVLWTKGAHSLKFGFSVLYNQTNTFDQFQIGGVWTFGGLTQFLKGTATSFVGTLPNNLAAGGFQYYNRDTRATELTPYVNDEWRVSPKLTLNLGLRYDYVTNPYEIHHEAYNLTNAPAAAPSSVPQLLGVPQISHIFTAGNPARLNLDPRVGVAYDPFGDHKTSIRAGFGMFHDVIQGRSYFPGIWDTPPTSFGQQVNPNYGAAFATVTPVALRINPGMDSRIHSTPYMAQWNLNIQHDFQGTILSVAYVGSAGAHLIVPQDANPVVPVNGAFSQLVGGRITPFARVNPSFGQLGLMEAQGHSNYNSLQASVNRRLARNVEAGVSYTYSHCIDDGSATYGQEGANNGGNQNPYDLAADRSNCGFDIRQALRANSVYYLPLRGNKLIEGWQASAILTATTGPWLTPTTGFDQIGMQNTAADRPNVVANCGSVVEGTAAQWFNPACFSLPGPVSGPNGTLVGFPGNASRTSIPGPHLTTLDFSMLKETKISKISESVNVQFRAEFFNILNHTNFGLPNQNIFTQSGTVSQTAGQITTMVGTPRQIQFGLKFLF